MSTLARAIEDDDAKMIEKELEKNVNLVRICDERGLLPLFVAAGLNRVNALRVFLERGDPRATSASTGNHVLHFAVLNGHVDTCKIILSKCPDLLDKPNRNGDTPLQTALVAGYWTVRQRVVSVLYSMIANFTSKISLQVAQFLINKNASVLPKNAHDMRAAHCLCVAKPPSFMTPMRPKSKGENIVPPMKKGMNKMERWALLRKMLKPLLLEITENDKEADMCTIFIFKEYA